MPQPSNQETSQTQPGPSPAFSTTYSNPYDQQQTYVPPGQYGTLNSQESSSNNLSANLEVKQIDQQLSSGCYSCYNCWLYVMVISGFLTCVNLIFFGRISVTTFLYALESFLMANYAIAMIGALKNKDLGKARNGYRIAQICLFILLVLIALDTTFVLLEYVIKYQLIYFCGQLPLMAAYYFFVIFNPAAKIMGHLERRETLLDQPTSPENA